MAERVLLAVIRSLLGTGVMESMGIMARDDIKFVNLNIPTTQFFTDSPRLNERPSIVICSCLLITFAMSPL